MIAPAAVSSVGSESDRILNAWDHRQGASRFQNQGTQKHIAAAACSLRGRHADLRLGHPSDLSPVHQG